MSSDSADANDAEGPATSPLRTSERFSAQGSDITFQSSDGVLFHIHRSNLDAITAGFPPPGFETRDEVVHLDEDSETLELLFQFIYPRRHPDLASTNITILAPLAEAVEKYQVFSAMNICLIRMTNLLSAHPYEVMVWAARHGYSDILKEAAPLLLGKPLTEMVKKLPPNIVIPWVLYHESWREVLEKALLDPVWVTRGRAVHLLSYSDDRGQTHSQAPLVCLSCSLNLDIMFSQFIRELKTLSCLSDFDTLGDNIRCCTHVRSLIHTWRLGVKQQTQQIPTFDKFL